MNDNKKNEPQAPLLDHSYDGIQELDNHLPTWWLVSLWATVVFGFFYSVYYLFGSGPSLVDEFNKDRVNSQFAVLAKKGAGQSGPDEAELKAVLSKEENQKLGQAVFAGKCVSCHGAKGEGSIGPNLTDDYWIHGGKLVQVYGIIEKGVGDKGMPPWGSLLKPEEIQNVLAYLHTIRGSNPPNAKAPQGDLVEKGEL